MQGTGLSMATHRRSLQFLLSERAAITQASFHPLLILLITIMYNHFRKVIKIPQTKIGKNVDRPFSPKLLLNPKIPTKLQFAYIAT